MKPNQRSDSGSANSPINPSPNNNNNNNNSVSNGHKQGQNGGAGAANKPASTPEQPASVDSDDSQHNPG